MASSRRGGKTQGSRRNRQRPTFEDVQERLDSELPRRRVINVIPRGKNQEEYVLAMEDDDIDLVFAVGPAGCGKSLLATQMGIKLLNEKRVDKIVISRPAVSVDEKHGFLPGGIFQKMEVWMLPILDVFEMYYTKKEIQGLIEDGQLEIAPLAYMRGRSLAKCFIIADEMQNATPNQVQMLLTRAGEDTKIVMTGDPDQHDRGYEENGLIDFVQRLERKKSRHISSIRFHNGDIERSRLVREVLRIYG